MSIEHSFITNRDNQTLAERFNALIKDVNAFDCLVAYFYSSAFHLLYPALKQTEKIRILIGIGTDVQTGKQITEASTQRQPELGGWSEKNYQQEFSRQLIQEVESADDTLETSNSIQQFMALIKEKKLEIRVYPSRDIHAKLYILTFHKGDRDEGRVITGSSNFSMAGLKNNLEFNVELRDPRDHHFAREKFEELWLDSIPVEESYEHTIENDTWLSDTIPPYFLYLKFLYEYFKTDLLEPETIEGKHRPANFVDLKYQRQAVADAKKKLLGYGGVFIADVVGLGKTFIATMLAREVGGATLILAPPVLLPAWRDASLNFRITARWESIGMLQDIQKEDLDSYKNIIIDEAHRFRNEATQSYEALSKICRGKRIILVSATPYNNSPNDILSLLKLFQSPRNSNIPNMPDLESFFKRLQKDLQSTDRKENHTEYMEIVRANAKKIRNQVLKYLMVRRTRTEIKLYFKEDMKEQKLIFPTVHDPESLYYKLDKKTNKIFDASVLDIGKNLTYARYQPLLYLRTPLTREYEIQPWRNLGNLMKINLMKRLESSFYAFRKSLDRFITSHEHAINTFENGSVYISKKDIDKIYKLLEEDNEAAIDTLLQEDRAEKYSSSDFTEDYIKNLRADLIILQQLRNSWREVTDDPKRDRLVHELQELKDKHVIIFTESKDTAQYLKENSGDFNSRAFLFTGQLKKDDRDEVHRNFDASRKETEQKNDYTILITTDVLAEGVNLHRANIIFNYDIPWNPTRMMQRIGRINRIDTLHREIKSYNFFPVEQVNDMIKLQEAAKAKIHAFLELLGGDAMLLTEGEPIGSHGLFESLSKINDADEEQEAEASELRYLNIIRTIYKEDPQLFEKIESLPKKARSGRISPNDTQSLVTYFKKGALDKFYMASKQNETAEELDFIHAVQKFECKINEPRAATILDDYHALLPKNKQAFTEEIEQENVRGEQPRGRAGYIIKMARWAKQNRSLLTEQQAATLEIVISCLYRGDIPSKTIGKMRDAIYALDKQDAGAVADVIYWNIDQKLLTGHYSTAPGSSRNEKPEIILSLSLAEKRSRE